MEADTLIVCTYNLMIPSAIFSHFKTSINIHPGILPQNAGPSPIQWAIRKKHSSAGVTAHILTEEFDGGDIAGKIEFPIEPFDTCASLNYKITDIYGPELFMRTAIDIQLNRLKKQPQNKSLRQYNPKYTLELSEINFETETADEIILKILAGNPYYPAHFSVNNKTIIVWDARKIEKTFTAKPGEAIEISSGGLVLQTAQGAIELLSAQINDSVSPIISADKLVALI